MLKRLKLHNFKTFLNSEFQFSQRHLVVGKNNSGKTNLVSAIRFLSAMATVELDQAANAVPGGIGELANWNVDDRNIELSCVCELELLDHTYTYEYLAVLELLATSPTDVNGQLRVTSEKLFIRGGDYSDTLLIDNDGYESQLLHEEHARHSTEPHRAKTLSPRNATMLSKLYQLESNRRAIHFRDYLRGWLYFTFNPTAIRHEWDAPLTPWSAIDPRGGQLATAIFHLKSMDERRYRRIIEHVRTIEPRLQAINFIFAPDQRPVPFVELSGRSRASWTGLSDGTLRMLGMAYVLEIAGLRKSYDWPPLLAIVEEPENGIFPGQIRTLYDLFEEWAPEGQFIFTSHSPYFIDMFNDKRECVTVLRRMDYRSVSATPNGVETSLDSDMTLSQQYAAEFYE